MQQYSCSSHVQHLTKVCSQLMSMQLWSKAMHAWLCVVLQAVRPTAAGSHP